MFKTVCVVAGALVLFGGGLSAAEEKFGVQVYPGAKYDEPSTRVQLEVIKATGGGSGACYRTKDPVKKVADFYQKQGFKPPYGTVTETDAMLQKGTDLSMTVKFMKPLDNTNDTRICIAKKK